MEQQQAFVFDKAKIAELFGDIPESAQNALLFLWKEGTDKRDPENNTIINISPSQTDIHIVLPDNGIRYQLAGAKTIHRTEATKSKTVFDAANRPFALYQGFDGHCSSQFTTIKGVNVLIEVVRYNTRKPLTHGAYRYELLTTREGGIRKYDIGEQPLFTISQTDAAVYYFFLLSHWNAENPLKAIYKPLQSNLWVFYEKDEKKQVEQEDKHLQLLTHSLNRWAAIKDDSARIMAVASKFTELNTETPYKEALKVASNLSDKKKALSNMVSNPKWIKEFIEAVDAVGEFDTYTISEIKTKLADGIKLGVIKRNPTTNTLELNHKAESGLFADRFKGTDFADRLYAFHSWGVGEPVSMDKYSDLVFDSAQEDIYQILFAEIEREAKKHPDGESDNYTYDLSTNTFMGKNNRWAKAEKSKK